MAQQLRIEIVDLKRRVMDMTCRVEAHKERMMVHVFLTQVDMCEEADFLPSVCFVGRGHVHEVRWDQVEIAGVKLNLFLEVLHAQTVVSKLVPVSNGMASRNKRLVLCTQQLVHPGISGMHPHELWRSRHCISTSQEGFLSRPVPGRTLNGLENLLDR